MDINNTWEIANNAPIKKGEFGLSTCKDDVKNKIIKLKKADKLAEEWGEFSFSTLDEDSQKTILNANPQLLRKSFLS